jgi:hypothetical protein
VQARTSLIEQKAILACSVWSPTGIHRDELLEQDLLLPYDFGSRADLITQGFDLARIAPV